MCIVIIVVTWLVVSEISFDSTRQKYARILFENGQVVDLVADAMEARYAPCRSNVKFGSV